MIDPNLPIEFDDGLPCEVSHVDSPSKSGRGKLYGRQIYVVSSYSHARCDVIPRERREIGFFNEFGGEFGYSEGDPSRRRIVNSGPSVIEDWRL